MMRIIELKGLNTLNKGAHLMLETVLSQVKENVEKPIFCYKNQWGLDYRDAGRNNILKIIDFPNVKKIPWNKLLALLPKRVLYEHSLVLQKDVQIILDGSGFAYGDFWGERKIINRLGEFIDGKKYSPNTKLILLPQAFGPFDNLEVRKQFGRVVQKANLIYARDEVSYNHLVKVYGERTNIKLAPDFTNLLSSGCEKKYSEGDVCIIPNYKMFEVVEDEAKYFNFFVKIIEKIRERGANPYFLIHEGDRDFEIAEKVNEKLNKKIEIVSEYEPVLIKNRIKSSELIIVSRFHGLVSALCQGIPVLTTSWSHKYDMLLKDYAQKENMIKIQDPNWRNIESYLDTHLFKKEENYRKFKKHIDFEKQKSQIAFKEILAEIQNI